MFDVHGRNSSFQCLAVHEEDKQTDVFCEERPQEALEKNKRTTLLAWFKLNKEDNWAHSLKYHEIPKKYIWDVKGMKWHECKRGNMIGRVYTTNPTQGERHYLHMLLYHVSGPMCYADLKTLSDGTQCESSKVTEIHLCLLATDGEWNESLAEASASFLPDQIQFLFVTVVLFGKYAKPQDL